MKKLSIFSFLFLFALSLFAQENSAQCSAIVLENGNEIPAYVDHQQSGQLYYKKCPDSTGRQYSIPVNIVKFIREPDGVIQWISEYKIELPYESLSKINEHSIDKWKFRNKTNNKTRSVSQGQNVKVVVNSINKVLQIEGRWVMLTATELILDTEANPSLAIPKKNIKKIVVYNKDKEKVKKKRKAKWLLFLLGIPLLLIFAVIGAGGLLIGLLSTMVISLIVIIAMSTNSTIKTKTIKHPFKGEWEITAPANEINDVREIYKQP